MENTSNTHETANGVYSGLPGVDYRDPLCLTVNYLLHSDFRMLVSALKGVSIINVIEIKSCELIQYWIKCPKEHDNLITDYAFQTFIKNPVFQRYYHNSDAFKKIAEKYIDENKSSCKVCGKVTEAITLGGECEACLNARLFPNAR